jgi:tRNA (Thr-GGU) A37 N-methylase
VLNLQIDQINLLQISWRIKNSKTMSSNRKNKELVLVKELKDKTPRIDQIKKVWILLQFNNKNRCNKAIDNKIKQEKLKRVKAMKQHQNLLN